MIHSPNVLTRCKDLIITHNNKRVRSLICHNQVPQTWKISSTQGHWTKIYNKQNITGCPQCCYLQGIIKQFKAGFCLEFRSHRYLI